MEPTTPQAHQNQSSQKAYGKKPVWQWVAIYAVIGVVIYGLIYYFYLSKKQNSPYSSTSQNSDATQTYPTAPTTDTSGTGNSKAEVVTITLTKSGFNPQKVTVKAGTKVTWINQSGGTATVDSADHPTHLKYPPLNLGSFANGGSLSLVFDKTGTYGYHNHLNSSQFGTVTVE